MDDCLFCRIVRGEIPAAVVYEDEHVIAFDDITPQAPVHTLIIPRVHYADMNADIPAEQLAALFSAVSHVAEIKGIAESGYRMIVNTGDDANQTVHHLHVHVIGGRSLAHGMVIFGDE
jgi:histidine triad (HIT) family protein